MIYSNTSKLNYEKIEISLNYLISTKTQNHTRYLSLLLLFCIHGEIQFSNRIFTDFYSE